MNDQTTSILSAETESESWFLTQLESTPLPVARLTAVLDGLAAKGARSQADTRARLLQDLLKEQPQGDAALSILARRARWMPAEPASLQRVREEALDLLGPTPERRAMADHAGFDKNLPPGECMRRLLLLLALAPAVLCYDKTWGFGVVRRLDPFYKRVEIDFENKPGHQMSFAYAAETLRLLQEDHLLARIHRDPEGMARMAAEQPAECVRLALLSFGPLSVVQLQEHLVPRLVAEADWKKFWDSARKAMKKDPCFVIPAKRTEPLTWQKNAEGYGEAWFKTLAVERDMKRILDWLDERDASDGSAALTDEHQAVVRDRLAFVLLGARGQHAGFTMRALLAADRLGLGEALEVRRRLQAIVEDEKTFTETLRDIGMKDMRETIGLCERQLGEAFFDAVMPRFNAMDIGPLSELIERLQARGQETRVADTVREFVGAKKAGIEILLWIIRHPDRIEAWRLGTRPDLVRLMLNALDEKYFYEQLKARNQLRDRFEKPEWLDAAVESMNEEQRRELIFRLKDCAAWPSLERKAMLGKLIKRFPSLEAAMTAPAAGAAPVPMATVPGQTYTSTRTYLQRQAQLRKLVTIDIPQNSKDIGVARSYGDLRENFEYKAAKEMQTVLMRRQGELEQMLREVQPSEFEGMPFDRAGQATGVRVRYAEGHTEQYYILGAWDRDQALGIISSTTKLALALEGHGPGDTVRLPGEQGGEIEATIEEVTPLPDRIRAWIRDTAS